MKLVTVAEMKSIEREADGQGLTFEKMMENAGRGLADEVMKLAYFQDDEEGTQVLGLVGPGNNGGDTLIALARLAEKGWTARAYLVHRKHSKDHLVKHLEEAGGEIYLHEADPDLQQLQAFLESADIFLDGVLGTGFKLPLRENVGHVLAAAQRIIEKMDWPPFIVAVDCPSGVDCDTGDMAADVIPADATVTMGAIKQGLLKAPAYGIVGEIRVVGIGNLETNKSWQGIHNEVANDELVASILPIRSLDAYKGNFGSTMVVAGSINYTGAALLAGKAAYRSGAGLVTLAIPASLHGALAGHLPEATWLLLPHEQGVIAKSASDVLRANLERTTAMLIGPGLGMENTTGEFIEEILGFQGSPSAHGRMGFIQNKNTLLERTTTLPPLVIDADGLKLLVKIPNWIGLLQPSSILTPHPGEMAIMTRLAVDLIQKHRLEVARKFAVDWNQIVVLKGAFTVIASPDGRSTTIPVATPALARAGTGDVLAGLITGLLGQGMSAYDAAVAGAWIHAQAGLVASDALGDAAVLAGDVLDAVPDVMKNL